ncbi:MAG TPA: prepilin-type N-terminal cleavage/methylation domain-containing protein [Albitalea sp.]|nr:prepilin-type N-terminal cleavage/methylation domain-containing protein [Albitalea sp.]
MRPLSRQRHERAFTLVEVLVAMMIMAILALMAWQGVDGIVRARDASQTRLEQTLRLNTVLAQWEQDLASVQETPAVPGLTFDGATVRLTRRAEGGMQVVTWSLRPAPDGGSGGGSWWRWASPIVANTNELQETWMRTQQFQGNEIGQLRTLTGIAQWQVYCYWGSWSNCQSTGDVAAPVPGQPASAPRSTRQALPAGVRLVIDFAGGDLNGSLARDVALGP